MTGRRYRKRGDPDDDDGGRRKRAILPGHIFHDIGEPIFEAPFRPRTLKRDPEAFLAQAFAAMGRPEGYRE